MASIPVYVGLDYHSVEVQVCVVDKRGKVLVNRPCANLWCAIANLAGRYGQVQGAALEACSGAADLAEELVRHAGWTVNLAHPGFVARMKTNPDKHDFGDARMLADLERVGYLPRVWLAPEELRELRRLVRYRQQVATERRKTKLRVVALLRDLRLRCQTARTWRKDWLRWLREDVPLKPQSRWIIDRHLKRLDEIAQELEEVEDRLAALTKEDPMVRELLKHKGIGPVTAWIMRAEIGRFDRFRSGKQLARFCGLSPRNASSGQRQADAGLIQAGNRELRACLMEAAHRLCRFDVRWCLLAAKMQRRGKPKCLIVAAVANRWMRWLYHQVQLPRQVA